MPHTLVAFLLLALASPTFAQISHLSELMPPPKTAYLNSSEDLDLTNEFVIVTSFKAKDSTSKLIDKATSGVKQTMQTQVKLPAPQVVDLAEYDASRPAIIVGVQGYDALFDTIVAKALTRGELLEKREGYLLHVTHDRVIIAGADTSGLMHGVQRFAELWKGGSKYLAAHILDHPDFPNRWAFSMHNLRATGAVNTMKRITDTLARYHYSGIQQNDFKYSLLDEQPDFYFKNVDTIKQHAYDRQLEIIPGVAPIGYSEGILWKDPNLAEGMPATATYVVQNGSAVLLQTQQTAVINGGFEAVNGSAFTGFNFYDNENNATQPDATVKRTGAFSARTIDPAKANSAGNARFNVAVTTEKFRYYYMSAWVRTEDIDRGEIRLLAIGYDDVTSRPLTHTAFTIPATTDRSKNDGWVKLGVLFNSLNFEKMYLYAGIWGGNTGTIWWDDFSIQEAGLVNVLRRPGTPLWVKNKKTGKVYEEGVDFRPVVDVEMEKARGQYTYHEPASLFGFDLGSIKENDTLEVSFYHPFVTHNDVNGVGQVMVCPSESKLYDILNDQILRVKDLHDGPHKYMVGHDEIRVMNWDSACLARNMTPAELLGHNVRQVHAMIKSAEPNAEVYAWSDMFDSLHNAVNNYYLVNGDLRGVWNLIPKDITILNWNNGKPTQSLEFFESHGFKQMPAPYYDAGNTVNMRKWRLALEAIGGATGMMYTTWIADYSHLRPFGYYTWSAGPYMMHKPLMIGAMDQPPFDVSAEILSDPFDAADSIVSATVYYATTGYDLSSQQAMQHGSGDNWSAKLVQKPSAYKIIAMNLQGITRETPTYILADVTGDVASEETIDRSLIYPNPATDRISASSGIIRKITSITGVSMMVGATSFDVSSLSPGVYHVEIEREGELMTEKLVIE
jgi:hypothetical protein